MFGFKTKTKKVITPKVNPNAGDFQYELSKQGKEILTEANRILALEQHRELFERTRDKGFENIVDIGDYEENYDISGLITYYRQWYPQNNCLLENQIAGACKKYGLLFGDVDDYTGNIPYKNLKDIDSFKLRYADKKVKVSWTYYKTQNKWVDGVDGESGKYEDVKESFTSEEWVSYSKYLGMKKKKDLSYVTLEEEKELKFKIVAPKRLMNTKGKEVRDGYKLEDDPVVFVEVKRNSQKAWLQITAWDKEAFLPEFQNPESN